MISWGTILYGAALTAIGTAVLVGGVGRERRVGLVAATFASSAAVVAWNAVLRATKAHNFFTDLPVAVFPVSWQDTGSGVWALAATAVTLGFTTHRSKPARAVCLLAVYAGIAAVVVDTYLY